jgi:hypothetical protein
MGFNVPEYGGCVVMVNLTRDVKIVIMYKLFLSAPIFISLRPYPPHQFAGIGQLIDLLNGRVAEGISTRALLAFLKLLRTCFWVIRLCQLRR